MAYDDDEETPNEAVAKSAGLIYVHDDDPGLTRVKAGTGFDYVDAKDRTVTDEKTLDRIRALAIPPAYADVWICKSARGHIQATGRDERGRKQYRYHEVWSAARAQTKFARMAAFGRALPSLREHVDHDLKKHGLPREKVVATIVRLLELTLIRVGNDEYAKENKSFGLTTMRARHLHLHGAEVEFEFKGKSGVQHKTAVHDRRLARVVKSIQELPGQRLFQYVDHDGARHAVESDDVNAYLQDALGEHFTAKDFRTWAGTLAAAKALSMHPAPHTAREAKKTITLCVKATAGLLGNTPRGLPLGLHPPGGDARLHRPAPARGIRGAGRRGVRGRGAEVPGCAQRRGGGRDGPVAQGAAEGVQALRLSDLR